MAKTVTIDESVWTELQSALKKAGLITSDAEAGPKEEATLGGRLKAARMRTGWSRERLAEVAGVGLNTIGRIEDYGMAPREKTLKKLAWALMKNPWWLLTGRGQEGGRAEACR